MFTFAAAELSVLSLLVYLLALVLQKSSQSVPAVMFEEGHHVMMILLPGIARLLASTITATCCNSFGLNCLCFLHNYPPQTSALDVKTDQLEERIYSLQLSITSAEAHIDRTAFEITYLRELFAFKLLDEGIIVGTICVAAAQD